MKLIIILLVHLSFIALEVYYDTLVHKAKTSTDTNRRKKYARVYHGLQLLIYFVIFLYGWYIFREYNLISYSILAIILNYTATRIWIFNPMYNTINDLARTYLSSSELYDSILNNFIKWIIKKTSIRNIGLVNMFLNITKAIVYFLSIIYLHQNL